ETIFVSARSDPPWRPVETDFVADAEPSRGPLSGIAAALSHAQSDHVLILAIDMPFITAEYLEILMREIRAGCGVVPMIGDRAEPLAAIYSPACASELRAA